MVLTIQIVLALIMLWIICNAFMVGVTNCKKYQEMTIFNKINKIDKYTDKEIEEAKNFTYTVAMIMFVSIVVFINMVIEIIY